MRRKSFFSRLAGAIFGYDFFIAYAWLDGRDYALELFRRLEERRFECFLDSEDYVTGDDWKRIGAWALQRTSYLILVASPAIHQSTAVEREVRLFKASGRRIFAIDFEGSLLSEGAESRIAGLLEPSTLTLRDTREALAKGTPRAELYEELSTGFKRARQETKRLRWVSAATVLLGVLAVVAAVSAARATAALHQVERAAVRAEVGRLAAEGQRLMPDLPQRGALLAAQAARLAGAKAEPLPPAAREALYSTLNNLSGQPLLASGLAWFRLSANSRWLVAGSSAGSVHIWRLGEKPAPVCRDLRLPAGEKILIAAFTPDQDGLILGGSRGSLSRARLAPRGCPSLGLLRRVPAPVTRLELSPDGRWLLAFQERERGQGRGQWMLWSWPLESGALQRTWAGRDLSLLQDHFDPGSRYLVTAPEEEDTLCVQDLRQALADDSCPRRLALPGGITLDIAFDPQGRRLATASTSRLIPVWDLSRHHGPEPSCTFGPFDQWPYALAFSRSGRLLYSAAADSWPNDPLQPVLAWDFSGNLPCPDPLSSDSRISGVTTISAFGESESVVAASWDGKVLTWDAATGRSSIRDAAATILRQLLPGNENEFLAAAGQGHQIELWPLVEGRLADPRILLRGFDHEVTNLVLSTNERWLVAASAEGELRLWDLAHGFLGQAEAADLSLGEQILADTCSEEGQVCIVGTAGRDLILWDLTQAERLVARRLTLELPESYGLWPSPSGRWLAVQSGNSQALELLNLMEEGVGLRPHKLLDTKGYGIANVVFDPGERWVFAIDPLGTVLGLWEITSAGPRRHDLAAPDGAIEVDWLAFHPGGALLAVIWDREGHKGDLLEIRSREGGHRPWQKVIFQQVVELPARAWFVTGGSRLLVEAAASADLENTEPPHLLWLRTVEKTSGAWSVGEVLHERSGQRVTAMNSRGSWAIVADDTAGYLALDLSRKPPMASSLSLPEGFDHQVLSPDARWLAARRSTTGAGPDLRIFHRSSRTWLPVAMIGGGAEPLREMAFSWSSRWLATGGDQGSVRLYELTEADSLRPVEVFRHSTWVKNLFFDRSDRFLMSGSEDGLLHRADLQVRELVEKLEKKVGRALTEGERLNAGMMEASDRARGPAGRSPQ